MAVETTALSMNLCMRLKEFIIYRNINSSTELPYIFKSTGQVKETSVTPAVSGIRGFSLSLLLLPILRVMDLSMCMGFTSTPTSTSMSVPFRIPAAPAGMCI